jgi:hypothetical protein
MSSTMIDSTAVPPPESGHQPHQYLLRLQSPDGNLHRLRALLKVLLRRYGLRCVLVEELQR